MSSPNATVPMVPLIPDVGSIAGPLLLGYLFNWGLFGALTVQVYLYYMAFPKDRLFSKLFVTFIYCLEIIQTVVATHDAWDTLGSGWGDPIQLQDIHLVWFSVPVMSGIISCSVQLFFAYRIWRLSGQIILGGLVAAVSLTQGITAIIAAVQALELNNLAELQDKVFALACVWLGGSALCDIMITICMFIYLSRTKTAFKGTQDIVARLIRLTIETGLVTATVALLDIILFVSLTTDYHITPALVLSKLYSNCVLVLFNSRIRIVGGRQQASSSNVYDSDRSTTSQVQSHFTRSLDVRAASTMRTPNDGTGSYGGINVEVRRDIVHDEYPMVGMGVAKIRGDDDSLEDNSTFKAKSLQDIEAHPATFMNI